MNSEQELEEAKNDFIHQWGVIGTRWGINRTMAQIHALLLASAESMSTDQVIEALEISRGNAHASLKEMMGMGIISKVIRKGIRKELYVAEKEPWKIFLLILRML